VTAVTGLPNAGTSWRVIGLHHVAFAHRDPEVPALLGDLLGLRCANEEAADGFTERMLDAGGTSVQLLQATGSGVIDKFVRERGPALHHVAFEVSDIGAAVADLRSRGVRFVDQAPRRGGMGTMIAFVHPRSCAGLLVELVDTAPGDSRAGTDYDTEGSRS
jgi:methylmalonyl-CoA/ethylmalonyl-CoA epimerase